MRRLEPFILALAVIAILVLPAITGYTQDGTLVFRDADGQETGVQQVVHSTQYAAMIEKQAAMLELLQAIDAKLDALVGGPTAPPPGGSVVVYINFDNSEALQKIPGIGPAKASAIVINRASFGHFTGWDDVQARRIGIGPGTVEDILLQNAVVVSFGEPEPLEVPGP